MHEYRHLASAIRNGGAWLDSTLQSYSMHHTSKLKDNALERIRRMRDLLDEAEKHIQEDEKELAR